MNEKDSEQEIRKRLGPVLKRLEREEPDPFAETRILARFDEFHRERKAGRAAARAGGWQGWLGSLGFPRAALGAALSLLLVLGGYWLGRSGSGGVSEIALGTPVAVSLAIQEMPKDSPIVRATVELPSGVQFYVPGGGELAAQVARMNSVDLEISPDQAGKPIHLVVNGVAAGTRAIKIRFFNDKGQMVAERTQTIRFRDAQKGRI